MNTKRCNKCGQELSLDAFYKGGGRYGVRPICKTCFKSDCAQRMQRSREVTVTEKRCQICGQTKAANAFKRTNGTRDGLVGMCKDCRNARTRVEYALDPSKQEDRNDKWRRAHLDKAEAANILGQKRRRIALKLAGKDALTSEQLAGLLAQGCRFCGTNENVGMAHDLAVIKGGLTTKDNCFCLCRKHNAQMGTLNYNEALARRRFK